MKAIWVGSPNYTPPTYSHFPAYCTQESAGGDFGIQVSTNGFILETYTLKSTN